jgi:hypothetical protein
MTIDDAKTELLHLLCDGVDEGTVWRNKRGKHIVRLTSVGSVKVAYYVAHNGMFYETTLLGFRAQFEPV